MAVSVAFCIFMRKCAMLGVRSGRDRAVEQIPGFLIKDRWV